jgi:hypothetical protein
MLEFSHYYLLKKTAENRIDELHKEAASRTVRRAVKARRRCTALQATLELLRDELAELESGVSAAAPGSRFRRGLGVTGRLRGAK